MSLQRCSRKPQTRPQTDAREKLNRRGTEGFIPTTRPEWPAAHRPEGRERFVLHRKDRQARKVHRKEHRMIELAMQSSDAIQLRGKQSGTGRTAEEKVRAIPRAVRIRIGIGR